jgi:hypothetical protein
MLTRTHLTLTLAALLSTAATACVIVDDTTTTSGTGGQGTGGSASSTGGSGTGGSGNTSTASTGGGGTGGGTTCVGPDGTGTTVDACADMEASQFSTCPSTGAPPPATGACVRGNELFSAGTWEDLLACLSQIPATQQEACDEPKAGDLVSACLADMYNDACVQQPIVDECDSIKAQCDGAGQPGYDVDGCKADLNPFSAAGVAEYEDCFANAPAEITCAEIHGYCIDALFQ